MHPVRHTDLNLFRVFDRVMTTEGISSAAERLDMTPAAVSQSIKRLSEIIGEPLFRRKGRGIVPTARALSLHREVREALHIVERSLLVSQDFDPTRSQRVFRIASHPDLDMILLPPLLQHLSRTAPYCMIESVPGLLDESSRQLALRQHNIDLVIASTPIEERGFYNAALLEMEMRVVCRHDHPRIRGQLSFEQFFAEEHVVWDIRRKDDWVIRSLTKHALPARRIAYESNALLTALAMVSQTDWLCVTSLRHLAKMRQALQLQDFAIPWESDPCPVFINWHQPPGRNLGLEWLLTQIRHVISAENLPL
ncbi:MAG: LysR family transcriptional regulator [Plesiomonas shigelloides]